MFWKLVDRVPWEAVLKGKGFQEGWTSFSGHLHVPKDEPAWKKTDLAEQRTLAGTQETKESLRPLEERQLRKTARMS